MAKARVEYVLLGISPGYEAYAENVVKQLVGVEPAFSVTTTATVAGSRPQVPANPSTGQYGRLYARITAVTGNVIVAWGSDPTAAQNAGLLVMEGGVEAIAVDPGQKLSFVELT